MRETKDWLVRIYDNRNRIIDKWIIENRTETEALHEAEAEIARESTLQEKMFDWTMTESKKKLKETGI